MGQTVPESAAMRHRLRLFSTCPPSAEFEPAAYLEHACRVARWSEEWGCEGILIYSDNAQLDAWTVASAVMRATERIAPLVAVQPIYMHPYYVGKMVTTLSNVFRRRLFLNMVAGGFKGDLVALNDATPHDRRYERLVEYTTIVKRLLASDGPVSLDGSFYRVSNLKMTPPLDADLQPGITVSGSSEAGVSAAQELGAVAVQYPQPVHAYEAAPLPPGLDLGIRIGIVAREDAEDAWRAARARFPEDRRGQLAHQLAMKVSDSQWHKQLSELGEDAARGESPYWLVPFENYKTFCPYLVGDYDTVAAEVARYRSVGYETFILDVPESAEELEHIGKVFDLANEARR